MANLLNEYTLLTEYYNIKTIKDKLPKIEKENFGLVNYKKMMKLMKDIVYNLHENNKLIIKALNDTNINLSDKKVSKLKEAYLRNLEYIDVFNDAINKNKVPPIKFFFSMYGLYTNLIKLSVAAVVGILGIHILGSLSTFTGIALTGIVNVIAFKFILGTLIHKTLEKYKDMLFIELYKSENRDSKEKIISMVKDLEKDEEKTKRILMVYHHRDKLKNTNFK